MTKGAYIIDGVAIISITIIEVVAISHGINGLAISASMAMVGAIAGAPVVNAIRNKLTKRSQ